MSGLQKQMQKCSLRGKVPSGLPPMPPSGVPSGRTHGTSGGVGYRRKRDFKPTPWTNYFKECEDVKVDDSNIFRVYKSGNEGPVVLLLHGGGHSALSWAVLASTVTDLVKCRVVALDLRGHGDTKTGNEEDLSADTQARDIGNVIAAMYGEETPPPIIMVGHSMGGAIAIHTAIKDLVPSLIGLVVIDVVEGTALDALNSMQSFLRGRPQQFKSLEYAIEWAMKSGQIRNIESAKVSMIGQLKRVNTSSVESTQDAAMPGFSAHTDVIAEEDENTTETQSSSTFTIDEVSNSSVESTQDVAMPGLSAHTDVIAEEDENTTETQSSSTFTIDEETELIPYTWRIDLSKSEKYWKGWFQGMSNLFLSCSVPKMLILAGVDRLDRDLTIGQMQGKFQMQVLPQCGHAVHEDQPKMVADTLATFMLRNRFTEAISDFQRPFPSC